MIGARDALHDDIVSPARTRCRRKRRTGHELFSAVLGLGDLFTAALPYPMVKRAGTPLLVPTPGYAGHRLGALLTLAGTAALAAPVIAGAVLAANAPDAIRIGVLLPCAAGYGFALAVTGVRLAAKIAESALPEMCQVALRTAM